MSAREVAAHAEVISIHLALSKDTRGFVDAEILGQVKKAFINTARAEVLDGRTRRRGSHGACASGSTCLPMSQPGRRFFDDPLLYPTSSERIKRLGASTDQAQDAIAAETVRVVKIFRNRPSSERPERRSEPRHLYARRVTATCRACWPMSSNSFARRTIMQETENIIFEGAEAAVARINLDGEPPEATRTAIQSGHADVLDLQLVKL